MLEELKKKVFRANLDLVKHDSSSSHGEMYRPLTGQRDWLLSSPVELAMMI